MKQVQDDFNEDMPTHKPSYIVDGMTASTPVVDREALVRPVFDTVPSGNPLERYYRNEVFSFTLPSRGQWFGCDIPLKANGEVGVLPMTASDELMLKNPDALLNGSAVEHVIRSCMPALAHIQYLPMCDVEAILLAIKLASYGDKIEYEEKCPKCGTDHSGILSIRHLLEGVSYLEEQYPVRLNEELVAYLRPLSFKSQTKISIVTFEEAKKFQIFSQREDVTEEEKRAVLEGVSARIHNLNYEMMMDCVVEIVTPEARVVDRNHIMSFLKNAPIDMTKRIKDKLEEINATGVNNTIHGVCSSCEHEWDFALSIEPSHFFE